MGDDEYLRSATEHNDRAAARVELARDVRRFIDTRANVAATRRTIFHDRVPYDSRLWADFVDAFGASSLNIPEAYGGQGYGLEELAVLLAESGRTLHPSPLFSSATLATFVLLALEGAAGTEEILAKLAVNELTATLAFVEPGGNWDPHRISMVAQGSGPDVELNGEKIAVLDESADVILVIVRHAGGDGGLHVALASRDEAGLERRTLESFDPTRPVHSLRFSRVRARLLGDPQADYIEAIASALDRATVGLAIEMVAGARQCVGSAVSYASTRQQFGRSIGSYQAIKHLCADMLVEVELAQAIVDRATAALVSSNERSAAIASLAKLQASRAYTFAALNAVHIHGAMGFTWEHDAHLYVRRAKASDLFLGGTSYHRQRVIEDAHASKGDAHWYTPFGIDEGVSSREMALTRVGARAWLSDHAAPLTERNEMVIGLIREIGSVDEALTFRAWSKTKFDGGWAGITWPTRFGGRGGSMVDLLAWKSEVSQFDVLEGACPAGESMVGPILLEHGSDEQKERFLANILRGEHLWAQLFSEPEAGSDLASLRTTATWRDDHWVIKGQKIWSSFAQFADFGLLLARSEFGELRHRGITCFAIDLRAPGVTIRPIIQMNEQDSFCEVFLDDVVISDENRIGPRSEGWKVAMTTVTAERVELGLRCGVNLERLLGLAATPFAGSSLGDDFQDRIAELIERVESLRALGSSMVKKVIDGKSTGIEGSIAKLVGAELMNAAANLGLDMQGSLGLLSGEAALEGGVWQNAYLSSPARRIGGGTDEIQRNIIAERGLGLPRG